MAIGWLALTGIGAGVHMLGRFIENHGQQADHRKASRTTTTTVTSSRGSTGEWRQTVTRGSRVRRFTGREIAERAANSPLIGKGLQFAGGLGMIAGIVMGAHGCVDRNNLHIRSSLEQGLSPQPVALSSELFDTNGRVLPVSSKLESAAGAAVWSHAVDVSSKKPVTFVHFAGATSESLAPLQESLVDAAVANRVKEAVRESGSIEARTIASISREKATGLMRLGWEKMNRLQVHPVVAASGLGLYRMRSGRRGR